MEAYMQLFWMAMIPVAVSVILYLLDKKTAFGKMHNRWKQLIYGVIFGGIAVLSTEFGVSAVGVTMNVRDAAPVCAGLIFGAPAGIIAGVIGGVERFFAAYWGAGTYTQIACSVSTVLAGLFAAWLRKHMFDDKKPSWPYGLLTGTITEVVHMLMVFITHLDDVRKGFSVVQKCTIPMVGFCGLSVMLATLFVSLLGKEKLRQPQEKTKISQAFQKRLLICVCVGFVVTSVFTFILQDGVSNAETDNLLQLNISDIKRDITETSDAHLLSIAHAIAEDTMQIHDFASTGLSSLTEKYNVAEINLVDKRGIIVASTNKEFLNYNMASGKQSAEFMVLLGGLRKEYVQAYQPISYDSNIMRKYAGVALPSVGFVQVAYDAEGFQADIADRVAIAAANRHIRENGSVIICDAAFNIVSDIAGNVGRNLSVSGIQIDEATMSEGTRFEAEVYGKPSYCMYIKSEGYYIIGTMSKEEALYARDISTYVTAFMEVLIFTALFILIYFLLKSQVVNNIREVNDSLAQITNGDLNIQVNVRSNEEFASLSDDINSTVLTLKHYIAEAAARIDKELEFAKTIQSSALPSVFPPYPKRTEFDIWAGMKTAKEVGGDFYDFYMIGHDKLAFLIADVSGKGIPAAMFMMTAKTMIKSLAESGLEVEEVFTRANAQLCATNEAGMFVTGWMGVLDLRTGLVTFANAGHNPPVVKKKDGGFSYLKSRAGFVLAGMDGVKYRKNELQLEPGDTIYLYTDGVTEATDAQNELYGEDRLLNRLNTMEACDAETTCRTVKADVDAFVGEAPQFDDITMLCLTYKHPMEN